MELNKSSSTRHGIRFTARLPLSSLVVLGNTWGYIYSVCCDGGGAHPGKGDKRGKGEKGVRRVRRERERGEGI